MLGVDELFAIGREVGVDLFAYAKSEAVEAVGQGAGRGAQGQPHQGHERHSAEAGQRGRQPGAAGWNGARLGWRGGEGILGAAQQQAQGGAHVAGGLEAQLGVLFDGAENEGFEVAIDGRAQIGRPRRRLADDGGEDGAFGGSIEGALAGGQLVEHYTGAEDIARGTEGFAQHLFGGHVLGSAGDDAGAGAQIRLGWGGRFHELGEAEIEHFDDAIGADHDVIGLDVAMHDAGFVGGGEGGAELDGDLQQDLAVEAAFGGDLAQRLAVHELGGDVVVALGEIGIEDGEDVGVVEHGGGAGLALEALDQLGLFAAERQRQNFDGDAAVEAQVVAFVDDAHTAGSDAGAEAVVADDGSGGRQGGTAGGQEAGGIFEGAAFEERAAGSIAIGLQKAQHLRAQLAIAGTGRIERGGTVGFSEVAELVEQHAGPPVVLGTHWPERFTPACCGGVGPWGGWRRE